MSSAMPRPCWASLAAPPRPRPLPSFLSPSPARAGAALELATVLAPRLFLPLACTANLAKNLAAVAASATRAPIYRAFAKQNNMADITAKGGWVLCQGLGLWGRGRGGGGRICQGGQQNIRRQLCMLSHPTPPPVQARAWPTWPTCWGRPLASCSPAPPHPWCPPSACSPWDSSSPLGWRSTQWCCPTSTGPG